MRPWSGEAAASLKMPDGIKDICDLHQRYLTVKPFELGPYGQEPDEDGFNDAICGAIYLGEALDIAEVVERRSEE